MLTLVSKWEEGRVSLLAEEKDGQDDSYGMFDWDA